MDVFLINPIRISLLFTMTFQNITPYFKFQQYYALEIMYIYKTIPPTKTLGTHYWCSNFLLLVVFHLLRVLGVLEGFRVLKKLFHDELQWWWWVKDCIRVDFRASKGNYI